MLPSASKEEGILSDNDREILLEKGISLASDTRTKIFEEQLRELADYILENHLFDKYQCSLFDDSIGQPYTEDMLKLTSCGAGKMLDPGGAAAGFVSGAGGEGCGREERRCACGSGAVSDAAV